MSSADTAPTAYDGSSRPPPSKPLSRMGVILQLLPKIPLVARVALLHILHVSPQSKYMDLTTDVSVAVLRSFLSPSKQLTVTQTQKLVNKDPGVKGRIWVSNYTAPSPGRSVRDAVMRAITGLQEGSPLDSALLDSLSDAGPVEAEWTGYRAGAAEDSPLPPLSEQERYDEMMKEVKTPTTILYLHGGAYYLLDPCTHRPTTKTLAKLTGGRSYSVRYRLAPQHPFPAALVDALTSYLTLLHPPPGAFHAPVSSNHIVFSGDSAGGNLCLALLQTILELNRQAAANPHSTISWHGTEIPLPLPLPAGVAVSSPWLDMTHSSPSCTANAAFDYLPAFDPARPRSDPPPCPAWPASPPRKLLYVADELATHPLATLLVARSWAGAPPVYICTGWELLADEDKFLAAKLYADGVRVVFEEYEGMPHCFAQIFTRLEGSRRCMRGWSDFIKEVTGEYQGGEEGGEGKGREGSRFVTVRARTLEEVPIDVGRLAPYAEGEMRGRVLRRGGVRVGGLDDTAAKL